jgi:hypothetical protein
MAKALPHQRLLGRTTILALAVFGGVLGGALVACRHNGPNQPGTRTGAEAAPPVAVADAGASDAAVAAPGDAGAVGTVPLVAGGRACKLGGATATTGTQVMLFREADDFSKLLAAADAGANQQQRTEQFQNGGGALVPFGTACSALETLSAVVRVQITDGPWLGTLGWVPTDSVTVQ